MGQRRDELEAQLMAYLDGELTVEERAEVERRLASDGHLRALLDQLRAISTGLHRLPRARASSDLLDGIKARLERQALLGEPEKAPRPARKLSFFSRWAAAAVVVLMTGTAGYVTWLHNMREQATPSARREFAAADKSTPTLAERGQEEAEAARDPLVSRDSRKTLSMGRSAEKRFSLQGGSFGRSVAPAAPPAAAGPARAASNRAETMAAADAVNESIAKEHGPTTKTSAAAACGFAAGAVVAPSESVGGDGGFSLRANQPTATQPGVAGLLGIKEVARSAEKVFANLAMVASTSIADSDKGGPVLLEHAMPVSSQPASAPATMPSSSQPTTTSSETSVASQPLP